MQLTLNNGGELEPTPNLVMLTVVLLMSPFLGQRSLHALRYNCHVGFASVLVLFSALCY